MRKNILISASRSFSDDKDRSRVGGAESSLLQGSGLCTLISPGKGAATSAISKFANNNHSNKDRALLKAFALLRTMADRLNVTSSTVDKAGSLFKRVHQLRKLKGRGQDTICAAVLYIACRQESVPRAFKEVVAVSERSLKQVSRCFSLIKNELTLELETATSNDFMARFSASLNLAKEVDRAARLLLQEEKDDPKLIFSCRLIAWSAKEQGLVCGLSPLSVAGASIYMASCCATSARGGEDLDMRSIAEVNHNLPLEARICHREFCHFSCNCVLKSAQVTGASEATVRQTYRKLLPKADRLLPTDNSKMLAQIGKLPLR